MEQRIWHDLYPPGMSRELEYDEQETLVTLLNGAFERYVGQKAVTCNG
jgi:hypothetical protein